MDPKRRTPTRATRRFIQAAGPGRSTAVSIAPVDLELQRGDLVAGKYEIVARIGEGGMGHVYEAMDKRLGREVAIKLTRLDGGRHKLSADLLLHEAQRMAKVRHPNVVPVYDYGEHAGVPFCVMHLHRGMDLFDWAVRRGGPPVEVDEAIGILTQVCAGVAAIHEAGTVHYDLKPANILIGEDYSVAIADLGLAGPRFERGPDTPFSGTPGYVAPEVIVREQTATEYSDRADVYAIGMTAHWLLVGRVPADADDDDVVLANQVVGGFPMLSELRPELPTAIDAPVAEALSRWPQARPTALQLEKRFQDVRKALHGRRVAKRARVVVIDDDDDLRRLVSSTIRARFENVDVVGFADPQAAIRDVFDKPPDAVITDLEMPTANGLEVTATLRGGRSTKDVPIIVLTAVGAGPEWRLLKQLGASAFLLKPVEPDMLHDALRRALRHTDD